MHLVRTARSRQKYILFLMSGLIFAPMKSKLRDTDFVEFAIFSGRFFRYFYFYLSLFLNFRFTIFQRCVFYCDQFRTNTKLGKLNIVTIDWDKCVRNNDKRNKELLILVGAVVLIVLVFVLLIKWCRNCSVRKANRDRMDQYDSVQNVAEEI